MKSIIAAVQELTAMDPTDPKCAEATEKLVEATAAAEHKDIEESVASLKQAAEIPAKNYAKIASIAGDLMKVVQLSKHPENEGMRPKVASLVSKVAGLFAECDTADHLAGKSLEEIEKAVHSLYSNGAQNKAGTYNFKLRGKGHHGKE
jgi:hypothetical protein